MLVKDGEYPNSGDGRRKNYDLNDTGGWNNTLDVVNAEQRLKSMSEMRHDVIVQETNEDLADTQRSGGPESQPPGTMSTKHMPSNKGN